MSTLSPGCRLGSYEILSPLGTGGMGEVYRARDTRLDRTVAIKVLPAEPAEDADRRARFEREARLLAALNHPGIAHLYGFETAALSDGHEAHFLAMELVEGEDLATRLARGPVPIDDAIAIARQIAEAVEEAHERGIVHRDLKPANVKVTPDGKVKVLDFGLAKAWSGESTGGASSVDVSQTPTVANTGTQASAILGTAAYMAPEQARGRPVDKRADVWAFGVVLFEMLTGKRLFQGETVSDMLAAVLRQDIPWGILPVTTPAAVRRLLGRCLERDPKQRLRDVGEARIALDAGASPEPLLPAGSPRAKSLARFVPWLLTAAAVIAAGVWTQWARSAAGTGAPQVQQFDLAFPADIEPVTHFDNAFALSPDGRMVAMTGVRNGTRTIFVRRLESAEILEIAEVGGLVTGVFSPDSAKVALVTAGGRVTSLSLVDREKTVVASGADVAGGLGWGGAGLVFPRNGVLWLAPTGSGEPRALTTLDATRHEVRHIGPLFLPGGRIVLFSSLTTEPGLERIEAVSVDTGTRRVVVERATTPVWSPTGHLLFARDGVVLAADFDEKALQVRGVATPILASGVVGTSISGALCMQLSADGTLVYLPRDFLAQRLVSVGHEGSALTLDVPRGSYSLPRVSPDGRRVVFASELSQLETVDLARGTPAQLTPVVAGTSWGVWNRDGTRVAYRQFNTLFWMSTDGSDRQGDVKGAVTTDYPSAPGPDPDSLLVTRMLPETSADLYLLSLSGAFEPRPLLATRAYEGGAQLSPDGRWLAYVSNESGEFEVRVRRFPELDRQWQVSEGGGIQLRWSATGREIYYRGGQALMAVPFDGRASEPVMGKPLPLFRDQYDLGVGVTVANYDVTPDGRFLMLRRDAGGGHLRIVLNWTQELKRVLAKGASP